MTNNNVCDLSSKSLGIQCDPDFQEVFWYTVPEGDGRPPRGPFFGDKIKLQEHAARQEVVTLVSRPDGLHRTSCAADERAVLRRFPRLVACLAEGGYFSISEAIWIIRQYLLGQNGAIFGRTYSEAIQEWVAHYFGKATDGSPYGGTPESSQRWRKHYRENAQRKLVAVLEYREATEKLHGSTDGLTKLMLSAF